LSEWFSPANRKFTIAPFSHHPGLMQMGRLAARAPKDFLSRHRKNKTRSYGKN
jgi:hypothetical protein